MAASEKGGGKEERVKGAYLPFQVPSLPPEVLLTSVSTSCIESAPRGWGGALEFFA